MILLQTALLPLWASATITGIVTVIGFYFLRGGLALASKISDATNAKEEAVRLTTAYNGERDEVRQAILIDIPNHIKNTDVKIDQLGKSIEPLMMEFKTKSVFAKILGDKKREAFALLGDDTEIAEMIQVFENAMNEFYLAVNERDLYDITFFEIKTLFDTCAVSVRSYKDILTDYYGFAIETGKANTKYFLDSIKTMLGNGMNGREDFFHDSCIRYYDMQIRTLVTKRIEWNAKQETK